MIQINALARHTWIYDLKVGEKRSVTVAYVMTNITHEGRVLMYRGFLKAFGLQQDGRFSYLVLTVGLTRFNGHGFKSTYATFWSRSS